MLIDGHNRGLTEDFIRAYIVEGHFSRLTGVFCFLAWPGLVQMGSVTY